MVEAASERCMDSVLLLNLRCRVKSSVEHVSLASYSENYRSVLPLDLRCREQCQLYM